MFEHILLAIDGSDYSRNAIPAAIEVAKRFKADIHIVHVQEHSRGRAAAFPLIPKEEADRMVAEAVEAVRGAGVEAMGEVKHGFIGHVAEMIVEVAHQLGSDLIVMGSRGLSDVAGVFLGSVTHRVIHLADAAVLVDRSHHKAKAPSAAVGKAEATS